MSTVYDVETILYGLWGGALNFVFQRDADPQTGVYPITNRPIVPSPSAPTGIYAYPICYGLRQSGFAPANPVAAADGDIGSALPIWDIFIELAEYKLLTSIIGYFTDVTESDFGRSASYSEFAKRIQDRIDTLNTQLQKYLNPFRAGASSGAVRTVFPTSSVPPWGPGYNGRNRGGNYGGGRFGGFGGW